MKTVSTFAFAILALLICSITLQAASPSKGDGREYAIYAPPPVFSRAALRGPKPEDGLFELRLRSDGTIATVAVLKSTGSNIVDREAAAAFAKWRFRPGRQTVRIPLSFTRH